MSAIEGGPIISRVQVTSRLWASLCVRVNVEYIGRASNLEEPISLPVFPALMDIPGLTTCIRTTGVTRDGEKTINPLLVE